MNKYFIAIDKDDIIWGTGLTRSEAMQNGKSECRSQNSYGNKFDSELKTLRCTKSLYDEVVKNGYYHTSDEGDNDSSRAYWSYSKKRQIAYLPKKRKRKNVFSTL